MINIQNYVRAKSLEEAYTLNQKKSTRILGGMLWLKMAGNTVGTAVDLGGLGLDTIEESEEDFRLGTMATLRALSGTRAWPPTPAARPAGRCRTLWGCSSATWPRWAAACGGGSGFPTC